MQYSQTPKMKRHKHRPPLHITNPTRSLHPPPPTLHHHLLPTHHPHLPRIFRIHLHPPPGGRGIQLPCPPGLGARVEVEHVASGDEGEWVRGGGGFWGGFVVCGFEDCAPGWVEVFVVGQGEGGAGFEVVSLEERGHSCVWHG